MPRTPTFIALLFASLVAAPLLAQNDSPAPTDKAQLDTLPEKASYIMGMGLAKDLQRRIAALNYQGGGMNQKLVVQGLLDTLEDRELFTEAEAKSLADTIQQELLERRKAAEARRKLVSKRAAEEFVPVDQPKRGVLTLPGGIQYQVLRAGNGEKPATTDVVRVHYRGFMMDGSEFDSSYRTGQPATFRVGGVIAGWTKTLQQMTAGSKWRVYIPSELAYKDKGAGEIIPPNTPLVFEIDLLEIVKE